ncbi:MAG: DUF262 domain-containing protein [Candidatus Acidiferrales bacterium]
MNSVSTSFTVADYCNAMERGEIIVNKDYQRSDQVWPPAARSYLIETILKGFPIPKLYLYQVTDVKSKKTFKEIVDGQQRSVAIQDFLNDRLRLSKSAENGDLRNRLYSELEESDKHNFLDYGIDVDLFVSATPAEVVEVFRRMNSYTVPLNAEEQRHASYQGQFKWFINDIADKINAILLQAGIFKEKQLVRMADNKLLTELCDSFIHGIRTTDRKILDSIYSNRDVDFPEANDYRERLLESFGAIRNTEALHETVLMKPHMVYSLVQAITHVTKPVKKFNKIFKSPKLRSIDWAAALPNLTALAQAADADAPRGRFAKFTRASQEKTNVAETRKLRFMWMCKALTHERI